MAHDNKPTYPELWWIYDSRGIYLGNVAVHSTGNVSTQIGKDSRLYFDQLFTIARPFGSDAIEKDHSVIIPDVDKEAILAAFRGAGFITTRADEQDFEELALELEALESDQSGLFSLIYQGNTIPLPEGEFRVGRDSSGNDLIIADDNAVSRKHLLISVNNGICTVEDLNSTNGTRVEGALIKKLEIIDTTTIEIGNTEIVIESESWETVHPEYPDIEYEQGMADVWALQIMSYASSEFEYGTEENDYFDVLVLPNKQVIYAPEHVNIGRSVEALVDMIEDDWLSGHTDHPPIEIVYSSLSQLHSGKSYRASIVPAEIALQRTWNLSRKGRDHLQELMLGTRPMVLIYWKNLEEQTGLINRRDTIVAAVLPNGKVLTTSTLLRSHITEIIADFTDRWAENSNSYREKIVARAQDYLDEIDRYGSRNIDYPLRELKESDLTVPDTSDDFHINALYSEILRIYDSDLLGSDIVSYECGYEWLRNSMRLRVESNDPFKRTDLSRWESDDNVDNPDYRIENIYPWQKIRPEYPEILVPFNKINEDYKTHPGVWIMTNPSFFSVYPSIPSPFWFSDNVPVDTKIEAIVLPDGKVIDPYGLVNGLIGRMKKEFSIGVTLTGVPYGYELYDHLNAFHTGPEYLGIIVPADEVVRLMKQQAITNVGFSDSDIDLVAAIGSSDSDKDADDDDKIKIRMDMPKKDTAINKPNKYGPDSSSVRFERLKSHVVGPISPDFNIDDIHWVTDRLGITDYEGSVEAVNQGYFVINVAGEIKSEAHIHMDVDPGSGTVKRTLDKLARTINETMNADSETKVVVHCAMGMERSPLTVIWYLHKYQGMTLDEAYAITREKRESTIDRRNWIDL